MPAKGWQDPVKSDRDSRIVELYQAGVPVAEIGAQVGLGASHVSTIAKRAGLPPRRIHGQSACSLDRCDGKPVGKGYCRTHYLRWRKFGDPRAEAPAEGRRKTGVAARKQAQERHLPLDLGERRTQDKADDELTPRQLYLRNWWRNNREYSRERRREWRDDNLDLARMVNREWARNNRERMVVANARYAASHKGRYGCLVRAARERGHALELSIDEWFEIAQLPCSYCGTPGLSAPTGYGIDRIDSSLGYTKGNSTPCCRECNSMKSNLDADEFLSHVTKIAEFFRTGSGSA